MGDHNNLLVADGIEPNDERGIERHIDMGMGVRI